MLHAFGLFPEEFNQNISAVTVPLTGGKCSLTIDKALPEDAGRYMCKAENAAGKAECSCKVMVSGKSLQNHHHHHHHTLPPPLFLGESLPYKASEHFSLISNVWAREFGNATLKFCKAA